VYDFAITAIVFAKMIRETPICSRFIATIVLLMVATGFCGRAAPHRNNGFFGRFGLTSNGGDLTISYWNGQRF